MTRQNKVIGKYTFRNLFLRPCPGGGYKKRCLNLFRSQTNLKYHYKMKLISFLAITVLVEAFGPSQARIILKMAADPTGSILINANGHNFTLSAQNPNLLSTIFTYMDLLLTSSTDTPSPTTARPPPAAAVHRHVTTRGPAKPQMQEYNGSDEDDDDRDSAVNDDFDWHPTQYQTRHHRYSGGAFRPSRRRRRN